MSLDQERKIEKGASCKIRVFYPNPIGSIRDNSIAGTSLGRPNPLDDISTEYDVSYLVTVDAIYHELCFIDKENIRHRIMGLAYTIEEKMEDAGGIDTQA